MGRKELLFIFLLFIVASTVIFALGVKVGEYLFESECRAIVEHSLKTAKQEEPVIKEEIIVIEKETVKKAPEKDIEAEKVKPEKKIAQEPIRPRTSPRLQVEKVTSEISGKYTIQISSYQDEELAQQEAARLYDAGFKLAYYMKANIPNRGTWYRVGIGFFTSLSSARTFAEMLKDQDIIQTYLIRKVS